MGIARPQASAPHSVHLECCSPCRPSSTLQCSALMTSSKTHNNSLWSTPVAPFNKWEAKVREVSVSWPRSTLWQVFKCRSRCFHHLLNQRDFQCHGFELPFLSPWRFLSEICRGWGSLISLGSSSLCSIKHLCMQCTEDGVWFGGYFVPHFFYFSCMTLIKLFNLS